MLPFPKTANFPPFSSPDTPEPERPIVVPLDTPATVRSLDALFDSQAAVRSTVAPLDTPAIVRSFVALLDSQATVRSFVAPLDTPATMRSFIAPFDSQATVRSFVAPLDTPATVRSFVAPAGFPSNRALVRRTTGYPSNQLFLVLVLVLPWHLGCHDKYLYVVPCSVLAAPWLVTRWPLVYILGQFPAVGLLVARLAALVALGRVPLPLFSGQSVARCPS